MLFGQCPNGGGDKLKGASLRPIGFVALKPDFCHEFDVGTVAGPTCRYGNYWVPQCGTQWYPRYLWVLLGTNRGCYVLLGNGY